MAERITIKTPGKLMVAGEFAVLEPHHQLVVMAVNRYLYTTIYDSDVNEVHLENYKLYHQRFHFDGIKVTFEKEGPVIRFVKDALTTALTFLHESKVTLSPFTLSIHSELNDRATGQKYGLGSSAAVVTSVITAVLTKFLPKKPSKKIIFKLASIAHVKTQGSGSGADIAASTYGGVLNYASFQADWLLQKIDKTATIKDLVHKKWPYLSIEQTKFPTNVRVCVGWTGKPASTKSLVKELRKLKVHDASKYHTFLQRSKTAVASIQRGMKDNDLETFYKGIKLNREALSDVGKQANVEIETEKLYILSKEAERLGGVGKLSGAGGGDCGIAFVRNEAIARKLKTVWRKKGIKPLNLYISPHGSIQIKSSRSGRE